MAIDTKGKVYIDDLTTLSQEEMNAQAEIFAEGSPKLQQLLLFLWKNGIQTRACCAGHKNQQSGKIRAPYIQFYVDNIEDNVLKKLLFSLHKQKETLDYFGIAKLNDDQLHNGINSSGEFVTNNKGQSSTPLNIHLKNSVTFDETNLCEIVKEAFIENKNDTFEERTFESDATEIIDGAIALKHIDFSLLEPNDFWQIFPFYIQGKMTYLEIKNQNGELSYRCEYLINGKPWFLNDKKFFDKTIELAQKYQAEEIELE